MHFEIMILIASTILIWPSIFALIIEKEHCDRFYCPDNCNVTYKSDGCPHNCNCNSFKLCPLVSCPAKEPICAVHTNLDGCQTCACRQPYLVIDSSGDDTTIGNTTSSTNVGFVFVSRHDASSINRRLRDSPSDMGKFHGKKVLAAKMCTLTHLSKVDDCLREVIELKNFLRSKRRDDVIVTLNPMIETDKDDLINVCRVYNKALECIGVNIFTACRREHPDLSELDAVYGYACGAKEQVFMSHLECIQQSHLKSYRLAVCEDSAHRALRFIDVGAFDIDEKQKQKCEAMTWLIGCEKATIQRRCSLEARIVNEESLMSAIDYVAPECHPDFERKVFISDQEKKKQQHRSVDSKALSYLVKKEPLICTEANREEIRKQFRGLESDIRRQSELQSVVFPIAYVYSKSTLAQRCNEYRQAMHLTSSAAKRNCIRRHHIYNSVYFALNYPCGHGTEDYFLEHYECLRMVRRLSPVKRCESEAIRALNDPSNDACEAYVLLAHCIYDYAVTKCGYDGWEMEYQYMSVAISNTVPDCRIPRIVRPAAVVST